MDIINIKLCDLFVVGLSTTFEFFLTGHDVDPGFPTVTFNTYSLQAGCDATPERFNE
jgi:hypothetical protein